MIATRKGGTAVKKGDKLAGMRVIPLIIAEEKLTAAKAAAGDTPLLELRPWVRKTAAIVATGSEVKKGLIQDTFTPVVKDKLSAYGIETISVSYSGDGVENVAGAISQARQTGAEVILCTGGMSVDPDDNTPGGHQAERGEDRHLRRPGAARRYVPAGLLRRRHPRHGPARLRHVRRGHHLRPGAALGGGGCKRHQGVDRLPGGGRPVSGLPALPLAHLPLWKVKISPRRSVRRRFFPFVILI